MLAMNMEESVLLNDFGNINRKFSETGTAIFLHNPARIRVHRVDHDGQDRRGTQMLGENDSCEQLRSKYEKFLMTLKVPKNRGSGDCMTQALYSKSTMNKN